MPVDALADIQIKRQRIVVHTVGDAFDAGHQPGPAHFADQRQVFERLQARLEMAGNGARMLKQTLFQDIEVFQAPRRSRIGWLE